MHDSFLMQLACNSFEFVKQQASKVCEQPTTCSHQDQKVARLEVVIVHWIYSFGSHMGKLNVGLV